MRTLKLLLTDKYYRWATLKKLELKFLSLPGVKHIVDWNYAYKMNKNMQDVSQWEQYLEMKKVEKDSETFCFVAALTRLQVCIMAEGECKETFEQAKADVLSNEITNEPQLREFKEWLENIESRENNYSRVQKLINSFT